MAQAPFLQARLDTEDDTRALAAALAPRLHAGDVLLLHGPVGAGKTFFVRALIQTRLSAIGRMEEVPSPTFTLVQTYDVDDAEIWHADLYRLSGPGEIVELGLEEAFEAAIVLVEWPGKLGDLTPPGALELHFAYGPAETARTLAFRSADPRWRDRLSGLPSTEVPRLAG